MNCAVRQNTIVQSDRTQLCNPTEHNCAVRHNTIVQSDRTQLCNPTEHNCAVRHNTIVQSDRTQWINLCEISTLILTSVWMLLFGCYYMDVTIWMLLFGCYYLDVTVWMLLFGCYYLDITIWMLLFGCYYLDPAVQVTDLCQSLLCYMCCILGAVECLSGGLSTRRGYETTRITRCNPVRRK